MGMHDNPYWVFDFSVVFFKKATMRINIEELNDHRKENNYMRLFDFLIMNFVF